MLCNFMPDGKVFHIAKLSTVKWFLSLTQNRWKKAKVCLHEKRCNKETIRKTLLKIWHHSFPGSKYIMLKYKIILFSTAWQINQQGVSWPGRFKTNIDLVVKIKHLFCSSPPASKAKSLRYILFYIVYRAVVRIS